jgi:hypothetical protein
LLVHRAQGFDQWLRHADNLRLDTLVAMRRPRAKKFTVAVCCATLTLGACGGTGGNGDDTNAGVVCPATDPADMASGITQQRADLLLGLRESAAESCAAQLGWAFRVGRRDDESFALTMDYSAQRVTVEVDDDVVTLIGVG